jgi:hypothetical protein
MKIEPMSFWQLVVNNPEWVAALASIVFASFTVAVLIWQVCVMKAQVRIMKWQARASARYEHIQNRLIRLQHEHEWVLQKNRERAEILKSARKLHIAAGCLKEEKSIADSLHWSEVNDVAYELNGRLSILDVAAFMGPYDDWYPNLRQYLEAVVNALIADSDFNKTWDLSSDSPNLTTRKALNAAEQNYKMIDVFLDLEKAIRMEYFEFKQKWDALLV